MSKFIDLTGMIFGRLKVLQKATTKTAQHWNWECYCSCGNIINVSGPSLRNRTSTSCGCYKSELDKAKILPAGELSRRRSEKEKITRKEPKRREQKRKAQSKYAISDKAALAQFHRWASKRKKPVYITDEQLLSLRASPCHKCNNSIERTGICFILINARGPVSVDNVLPTCGFCKLIKPISEFNPISYASKLLRRGWKRTPMVALAKQKARKQRGLYQCAKCLNLFKEKDTQLDHKNPVVDTNMGFENLDIFARRLFCGEDNLQYLCKPCHLIKTNDENSKRRLNKGAKK